MSIAIAWMPRVISEEEMFVSFLWNRRFARHPYAVPGTVRRVVILLLIAFLSIPHAFAYDANGHEIVGAIAQQLLSPTTRNALKEDLRDVSLMEAGPWLDCAKNVQVTDDGSPWRFHYENPSIPEWKCPTFENAQFRKEMEEYVRANCPAPTMNKAGRYTCPSDEYHYTDISVAESGYSPDDLGANDHDVVAAINAIIVYLQNGAKAPAAKPFTFASRRQAIWALTHLIGDLHQPLHVGAVYLIEDPNNKGMYLPAPRGQERNAVATAGGNTIQDGVAVLHTEDWDDTKLVPIDPKTISSELIVKARRVPTPTSDPATWATIWASSTLLAADAVFAGTTYTRVEFDPNGRDEHGNRINPCKHENSKGTDPHEPRGKSDHLKTAYCITYPSHNAPKDHPYDPAAHRLAMQQRLLVEAGAHLAQVLNALYGTEWSKYPDHHYLSKADASMVLANLPKQPDVTDADTRAFFEQRALIGQARGDSAAADDVYNAEEVAPRFSEAFGRKLDDAAWVQRVMANVTSDEERALAPIKLAEADQGRARPFVAHPNEPGCPITYRTLAASGSYPSGHAMLGALWAGILTELDPTRKSELDARGLSFGESRVVCGFHYPSDIEAGRQAAALLLVKLKTDADFLADLACARDELAGKQESDGCSKRKDKIHQTD